MSVTYQFDFFIALFASFALAPTKNVFNIVK
jgi:hypothetical protein